MDESEPRIAEHYDELAQQWEEIADSPSRTQLLWSKIEEMLPNLTDRRVLDAGCGSGFYAGKLAKRGADVVGVDISEAMVEAARERHPEVTFQQADLTDSIGFIEDASIDVVLCQHVFSHIPDLAPPLNEFARVLSDEGTLVVSTHNPVHDYIVARDEHYPTIGDEADLDANVVTASDAPNYAETERFDIHWNPEMVGNRGTYYRRSMEGLLSPILGAGFELQELVEPMPDDAFRRDFPEVADQLQQYPSESVCLRGSR